MRRGLTQSGQTFALERFRGTADEWVEELRRIWRGLAFPRSEELSRQFPGYANRLRLIWAEREKVPARHQAYWTSEVMGSKPGTKNKGMLFFCHSHPEDRSPKNAFPARARVCVDPTGRISHK